MQCLGIESNAYVGGNDTYGITRIPTTVEGRGVVRRADQTRSTRFVYPGSGRGMRKTLLLLWWIVYLCS